MATDGITSGSLLGLSGSYWQTCTLHAGVKLELFSLLGTETLTAHDLALRRGADERALTMLLDALCAMQLLEKGADGYRNSAAACQLLSKDSPGYIGFMIMHHHHLLESWGRLDQAVLSGQPQRSRSSWTDEESRRESFLMGMFNQAMAAAPGLVATLDLSACRNLLDLGGGPGTWAIHFCQHNPQLQATVFDLPTTRPFAEQTIARFGLTERIRFVAGDFNQLQLEEGYDVAWLSHVLHGEGAHNCRTLIKQAAAALKPGGLLLVHEFILDNGRTAPLFAALFSLNMLLGTESGQAYSEAEIATFMREAGLRDIERTAYCGPTQSGVLLGRKTV